MMTLMVGYLLVASWCNNYAINASGILVTPPTISSLVPGFKRGEGEVEQS